jgi:hypothetical protein
MKHSIEDKLDRKWSIVIHEVWHEKCGMCNSKNGLSPHHILSRKNRTVRWLIKNGILICQKHHLLAHTQPSLFIEWLEARYGIDF